MDTSVLFKYSNDSFCFVFTLACQSLLWPKLTTTLLGGLRLACHIFLWPSTRIICFKIQGHVLVLHGKMLRNALSGKDARVVHTDLPGRIRLGSIPTKYMDVSYSSQLCQSYELVTAVQICPCLQSFCAYPQPHRNTSYVFLVASNNDDTECS